LSEGFSSFFEFLTRGISSGLYFKIEKIGKVSFKHLPSFVETTEREEIIKALEKTGYVKSRAAKLLGLTLRQLDYRIKKYNIELKKF